jgi:hypothetical protein
MKTITCNDEAVAKNRSNHLIGTRMLPTSDDSENDFFGTLGSTRAKSQPGHTLTGTTSLCVVFIPCPYYSSI